MVHDKLIAPSLASQARCDKRCYQCRIRIEIMFGRLKDWGRVAARYDNRVTTFFSAIVLAATAIFRFQLTSTGPK